MATSEDEPLEGEEVIDGNNDTFGNLSGLFKNIDMSQIMSLLGSVDFSQLSSLFGPMGMNSESIPNDPLPSGGKAYRVLNALKPMVNPEQVDLIDMILQIYTISKILK
jgi:hypothetical protein